MVILFIYSRSGGSEENYELRIHSSCGVVYSSKLYPTNETYLRAILIYLSQQMIDRTMSSVLIYVVDMRKGINLTSVTQSPYVPYHGTITIDSSVTDSKGLNARIIDFGPSIPDVN